MFNAFFKIPMQFIILLTGVMVYIFYQFHDSPLFFNTHVEKEILASSAGPAYTDLQETWNLERLNRQELYSDILLEQGRTIDQAPLQKSIIT